MNKTMCSYFAIGTIILIFCITISFCVNVNPRDSERPGNPQPVLSTSSAQPIQSLDSSDLTIDQAKKIVLTFLGSNESSLKFNRTLPDSSFGDIYEFTSDGGEFQVNSVSHQIQNVHFNNPASPSIKKVDREKAYLIASSYAREKYPQLWEIADNNGIKSNLFSSTQGYNIIWRNEIYYPDKTVPVHYNITGLNHVSVIVTISGSILSCEGAFTDIDPALDLEPNITENKAWDIAQEVYRKNGVNELKKITKNGLWVVTPQKNDQHLVWYFEAYGSANRGGIVWVDAHDGQTFEWVG